MSYALTLPERAFDSIGLMQGDWAAEKRMIFGALVGAAIVQYVQPKKMYTAGVPRPWDVLTKVPSNGAQPTNIPWFFAPIAGAFVCGILI